MLSWYTMNKGEAQTERKVCAPDELLFTVAEPKRRKVDELLFTKLEPETELERKRQRKVETESSRVQSLATLAERVASMDCQLNHEKERPLDLNTKARLWVLQRELSRIETHLAKTEQDEACAANVKVKVEAKGGVKRKCKAKREDEKQLQTCKDKKGKDKVSEKLGVEYEGNDESKGCKTPKRKLQENEKNQKGKGDLPENEKSKKLQEGKATLAKLEVKLEAKLEVKLEGEQWLPAVVDKGEYGDVVVKMTHLQLVIEMLKVTEPEHYNDSGTCLRCLRLPCPKPPAWPPSVARVQQCLEDLANQQRRQRTATQGGA